MAAYPKPAEDPVMTRRPTAYSPQIADQVCELIGANHSLLGLYRDRGLPARSTVVRWRAKYPEFAARYEAACRHRAADAARLNRPDAGVGGRPTLFSEDLAETICALIAAGASMQDLDSFPDIPSPATIYRWIEDDGDFRRAYAAACALRADLLADEALDIAQEALGDDWAMAPDGDGYAAARECLGWAKLKIDTIRWRLAVMAPRKYGPKPTDDDPETRPITLEEALMQLATEEEKEQWALRQVGGPDLGGG